MGRGGALTEECPVPKVTERVIDPESAEEKGISYTTGVCPRATVRNV